MGFLKAKGVDVNGWSQEDVDAINEMKQRFPDKPQKA